MSDITTTAPKKTAKDFASDHVFKFCTGCGDYSILSQVQKVFPDFDVKKENYVFISGIGCSSRFTYYMDTYGFHSIHGRAAAVASGVKATNPELDVWMISGDGDSISIGGNHFIHLMRRNFNIKYLMFNNEIYGLTKGQYSPLSEKGMVAKSTPFGSVDEPFNPLELALGAKCAFVARSLDRDPNTSRQCSSVRMSTKELRLSKFIRTVRYSTMVHFSRTRKKNPKKKSVFLWSTENQ
jgi:2-oxoglutarate ferredoxin oxidoreductase subunit beta